MAYNKYTWKSGDVISSARLNNIEDGIEEAMSSGGGVMIINVTLKDGEGYVADKTYDEIEAAIDGDQTVIVKYQPEVTGGLPVTETDYLTLKYTTLFRDDKRFIFGNGPDTRWHSIEIGPEFISVYGNFDTIQTKVTNTEINGSTQTTYSNVGVTYSDIIHNSNFGIKLLVQDTNKTMVYTMNEFYPGNRIIAFSGAGKVGPLYMDKDGNITETYPTSSGGGYS